MSAISVRQHTERSTPISLERLVLGTLLAMVFVWIPFQIVEIRSIFPPIGILYALGSIIVAGVVLMSRRAWAPAIASAWGVMMMIPETMPAIGHLTHWNEIYTHFGHYLVIMTFFPLAIALIAAGAVATVQNYTREPNDRYAPDWLPGALIGLIALIVIANAVTIGLYAFDIP